MNRADGPTIAVRGPYFDELHVGMSFTDPPAVDITEGLQGSHRAIVGNRLRLALASPLADVVTGQSPMASPALVWDLSIGQSTTVTEHVRANLFYRGLVFHRYPVIGDTLSTVTSVVGLRENTRRSGRPPTGLAALHVVTSDQAGRRVLDYWRCAMLPLSSEDAPPGRRDSMDQVGRDTDLTGFRAATAGWKLGQFRDRVPGDHFASVYRGKRWRVEGADVVSSAPELARLTGNVARVHHDFAAAGGQRLVYGGHTIDLAFHQLTRALPSLVTIAGWQGCDHIAPVFEGDRLNSTVIVRQVEPTPQGGGLVFLTVEVHALRGDTEVHVLTWRPVVVMA